MKRAAAALAWLLLASAAPPSVDDALIAGDTLPPRLSDFRFFVGGEPNARVHPYTLNTPLFSDYAEKARFIYVPPGKTARAIGEGLIDFPVGSALIKTFGYPGRTLETRVLLHRASGWVALPYVWDGRDALLKRGGTRIDVTVHGQPISYPVPNQNQCKECHQSAGALQPIGPKVRNMAQPLLADLVRAGLLDRAPAGMKLPHWDDTAAPVADRARAYFDVNCGHCHNRAGAASNSGLYLTWEEADPVARGIGKTPVAAGRGSGGLEVAIAPGEPDKSFLLYRMQSTEPGVAMPELGRSMTHTEGVALVRDYIAGMHASH
ncbi:SO2930 family diheme c-type cytochrome [Sphingomonas tabacisoli]|uniref:SO2930 family diheme c-type cytochrome n=1 Tax=Sphingomonas tabacisoli TaxID=2249466 RepID=A0ABW4I5Y2_9SPHN